MISFEREDHASRAEFNKPFSGIHVVPGDCVESLTSFNTEKWERPYVAWLDYDGLLEDTVSRAIHLFVKNCAVNSVLVISVNAKKANYSRDRHHDSRNKTSVGIVESMLTSGVTDTRFEPKLTSSGKQYIDLLNDDFPEYLASALLAYIAHLTVNGTRKAELAGVRFVPLFNLLHRDGVDMITIGGAFSLAGEEARWRTFIEDHPAIETDAGGNPAFQRLDLVPITLKEKLILDRCLPESEANYLLALDAAGIRLDLEVAKKYRRYYRQFPVFVESSL
jgi:hypothetical protein